jgi:hypothetical protein
MHIGQNGRGIGHFWPMASAILVKVTDASVTPDASDTGRCRYAKRPMYIGQNRRIGQFLWHRSPEFRLTKK